LKQKQGLFCIFVLIRNVNGLLIAIRIPISYYLNAKSREHLLDKRVCSGSQPKCPIDLMWLKKGKA
jgi:hypothetical protein